METMDLVQARTPKSVKNTANDILDTLGLNMSTYINMALKQLIIQGGILFSVKVSSDIYTPAEAIGEIDATLKMEGMTLTSDDLDMLKEIRTGKLTTDEARQKILSEV
ncbi:MAG: type II toxin-antitoxin system RelB/DinJ family antitoxin [Bacteroides thetaiotaomicron]|nr:type II toxin-antitoxin system RelB/DinJ family antitoxin [Bacteroides thetaiotaomicron]